MAFSSSILNLEINSLETLLAHEEVPKTKSAALKLATPLTFPTGTQRNYPEPVAPKYALRSDLTKEIKDYKLSLVQNNTGQPALFETYKGKENSLRADRGSIIR